MPYLGATELTVVLPAAVGNAITGSSTPLTFDEVGSIIARVSAEADSYAAAAGYAVPISTAATLAWAMMQRAVENGAGAVVMGRLFPNIGGPGDKSSLAADMRDAYQAFLSSLRKGELALVGASTGGAEGRELPRSAAVSNLSADASSMIPINWEP